MSSAAILSSGRSEASTTVERLLAASNSKAFPPCLVYPRDIREQVRRFLDERDYPPFGLHAARRIIPVLDAIAPILVSKESGEAFAIAVSVGSHGGLEIWISANGLDDIDVTKGYLQGLCDMLVALRKKAIGELPEKLREGTSLHGMLTFDDKAHLYYAVYTHCLGPIKKYARKASNLRMQDALSRAITRVSSGDESDDQMETVLDAYQKILAFYKLFENVLDADTVKVGMLRGLCRTISLSAELVRAYKEAGVNMDTLNDIGEESLREVKPDLEKPKAFERFWDKAFELERCVSELLELTLSGSMGKFLDKRITVEHVPKKKAILTYEHRVDPYVAHFFGERPDEGFAGSKTGTDPVKSEQAKKLGRDNTPMGGRPTTLKHQSSVPRPSTMDAFIDHLRKHDVCESLSEPMEVHAESLLLSHLVENRIEAFPYIAVSKTCCLGCRLFISAYNAVTRGKSNHRPFCVRGTHSRADNWVFPTSQADPWRSLLLDIKRQMLPQVEKCFEAAVLPDKLSRSFSTGDSSTKRQIIRISNVDNFEGWKNELKKTFQESWSEVTAMGK